MGLVYLTAREVIIATVTWWSGKARCLWGVVFMWQRQQTLSFAWAVPLRGHQVSQTGSDPPITRAHIKHSPSSFSFIVLLAVVLATI